MNSSFPLMPKPSDSGIVFSATATLCSSCDMKLPFVFLNLAMTADGKIASANRVIPSPGSPEDIARMMKLRTYADAVLSGARTVDLNDASLGPGGAKYRRMRLLRGLAAYNIRLIVSGSGSIDPN